MIKQAVISLVTDDSSDYPKGQADYNGKTTEFMRYSPYGLCSNPPKGSWVLLLASQAQSALKIGFISDVLNRKKGLKKGEVALFNTKTGAFVFLKEGGGIDIDVSSSPGAIVNLITSGGTPAGVVNGNTIDTFTGNPFSSASNPSATVKASS